MQSCRIVSDCKEVVNALRAIQKGHRRPKGRPSILTPSCIGSKRTRRSGLSSTAVANLGA
eukprot:5875767-Amphidinium_carterae.1